MAFDPTAASIGVPLVATYDNGAPGGVATLVKCEADGTLAVDVTVSIPPAGLATSEKQDTGNTSLAAIATSTAAGATAARQDTQTTALGLLATALAQTTGNASLATIAGKDFATATKQDTAQVSLTAIVGSTGASATAAAQITAQTSLTAIAASVAAVAPTPSPFANFGTLTAANVKGSAGKALAIAGFNANAATRYLQLHNKATIPLATEVPVFSFAVPTASGIVVDSGFFTAVGTAFSLGIGWAWSTTAGTFTDSATANEHTTDGVYV